MNKIAVTPREGFTVKDHTGAVIPEEGAMIDDSPVVGRRLREGLLVKGMPTESVEGGDDDGEDVLEIDKMTILELKETLTGAGVDFPSTANKKDLVVLLTEFLESQDGE